MQSINSIETHGHRTCKDLVCKEKEIKCNNIIKQYKNVYFIKKTQKNMIQIGQKFLTIHTKYL